MEGVAAGTEVSATEVGLLRSEDVVAVESDQMCLQDQKWVVS